MKYGLIGEKLGHSFSKDVHAQLFDYNYELCEIARSDFDAFMAKKDFRAINVTIPYKEMVMAHLDFVEQTAEKIGAVNTVVNKNGKLCLDRAGLMAYIHGEYFTIGKKIGSFGYSVKKPAKKRKAPKK